MRIMMADETNNISQADAGAETQPPQSMQLGSLFRSLARRMQPADLAQARLRIDLIHHTRGLRYPMVFAIFGLLFGAASLMWISPYATAVWTAAIFFIPLASRRLRQRILTTPYAPTQAGEFWLKMLLLILPLQALWLSYVPLCWIDGNVSNNAVLLAYLLIVIIAMLQVYGSCIYLSLPPLVMSLPLIFIYRLHTDSWLDLFVPAMMGLFIALQIFLAREQFEAFRDAWARRLMFENMARSLAAARDEAERDSKAKSRFVASLSHELRTPLNAVIGFADMMRQSVYGTVQPVKYREYVEDIYFSGQHLLELINDVLDLSKIEAGRRELTDSEIVLTTIAQNAALFVHQQAKTARVAIDIDIPSGLSLIADERSLRQILINLLSNAIKFSPSGGQVRVFATLNRDGGLRLGVADQGIGMDANGLRKALEPYGQVDMHTTTNGAEFSGTGLGLPIAKALVEAHGASFHIESAIGLGTTVWGEFPPARVPAQAPIATRK